MNSEQQVHVVCHVLPTLRLPGHHRGRPPHSHTRISTRAENDMPMTGSLSLCLEQNNIESMYE